MIDSHSTTSDGSASDVGAARGPDSDAQFVKPIEWDDLLYYLERRGTGQPVGAIAPDPDSKSAKSENRMTVIIVEDDAAMRALLEDVLTRAGHRVIPLANGVHLRTIVERAAFDVVILDKEMPGPDGLDLLSYLRRTKPDVPVIFITAFGGPAVAEEATRRGAWSYLEKPFRVSTILDAMEAIPEYRRRQL